MLLPDCQHTPLDAPALELRDVRKTVRVGFRGRPLEILRGVSLEVGRGDVFGLLGPNGAGKTTAVKIALGLMKPSAGTISIGVAGRESIGYLPENPYFYDYLTGREFLRFCARLFDLESAARRRRVDELLHEVGLAEAADTQLRKYSKGMLQRIGIAQALVNDPDLVLLDEPMTGLDPIGRVEVKRIMKELHEAGKTILFNSHALSDVAELCTHLAIMRSGVVVWDGTVPDALAEGDGDIERFFMLQVQS